MPYLGRNPDQGNFSDLNGGKLIFDADADTSITADTDDQLDIEIAGANDFQFTANTFTVLSGSTLTIASGATIANSGTATGFSSADPSSADGDSLGTASAEWSDLYLADGGVVYFGNDQEITLTHSADTGLLLKHTATADDKPINLVLQTGETDMAANDVIGKISFQAPDEGTGTDAILVSAAIQAVAEGDHSSSSNATRLEFMLGASEAAATVASLSSVGALSVGNGSASLPSLTFASDTDSGLYRVNANQLGLTVAGTAAVRWESSCQRMETNGTAAAPVYAFINDVDTGMFLSATGKLGIATGGDTTAIFESVKFHLNETANGDSTIGMTINQGGQDNQIFALKSSDIAHPFTGVLEADTYLHISKGNSTAGNALIEGFSETTGGLVLRGNSGEANTTNGTSGVGTVQIDAYKTDGSTSRAVPGADDNMLSVRSGGNAKFLVKGDGDIYYDGADQGAYDAYEDAHISRALDLSHGKGIIDSKFDKFIAYNHEKLADMELVGREEDGTPNHFISITGLQRLHNGAIWQQYERHENLLNAVYELAVEAVGEDKANRILDKNDIELLLSKNELLN